MKTYYLHSKTDGGRRFTVAGLVEQQKDCYVVNGGVALCSGKDQFVKRIGRDIASGRARKKQNFVKVFKREPEPQSVVRYIKQFSEVFAKEN